MARQWASTNRERKKWRQGKTLIAGVDEAGRGALAGPIVAAAVIMPTGYRLRVADSKILSPLARERLFVEITTTARAWSIASIEADEIDHAGINPANEAVVRLSVGRLRLVPDYVFVDAVRLRQTPDHWESVVDGDATISVIAAASIVAKVARDAMMRSHHDRLPLWHFARHKGYGTELHFASIKKHGLSPIHRRTFVSPE